MGKFQPELRAFLRELFPYFSPQFGVTLAVWLLYICPNNSALTPFSMEPPTSKDILGGEREMWHRPEVNVLQIHDIYVFKKFMTIEKHI